MRRHSLSVVLSLKDFDKAPFIKVSQEQIYPMFYGKIFPSEAEGRKVIQQIVDTK